MKGADKSVCTLCGLSMKNGVQHICFSHIEPIDFNLYWKSGKFYQQEGHGGGGYVAANTIILFWAKLALGFIVGTTRHGFVI